MAQLDGNELFSVANYGVVKLKRAFSYTFILRASLERLVFVDDLMFNLEVITQKVLTRTPTIRFGNKHCRQVTVTHMCYHEEHIF